MQAKYRPLVFAVTVLFAFALNSCSDTHVPSSSASNMLVATQDDHMVRSYTLDRTNGSISVGGSNGSPVATGVQPSAIVIANGGMNAYIANAGDNNISVYNVNSNGTLVVGGPPVRAGTTPTAMAVDATGTLLFVANYGSDAIMVFGTSAGTPILQTSFPVQIPVASGGSGPMALALAPGNFPCIDNRAVTNPVTRICYALYAANQISGTVTAYDYFLDSGGTFIRGSIDLNGNFIVGGTVAGSPYSVGTNPSGLAFSRCAGVTSSTRGTACAAGDGNNLFVSNSGSDDISIFAACIQLETCHSGESNPDGTLFPIGSPVAAGTGPTTVLVNGAADFVYVVDSGSNQISEYQYAPFTGALTPIGVTNASSTPLLLGAITPGAVVAASNGALSSYTIGSDGTLAAPASGQLTIQGQPSAILIR